MHEKGLHAICGQHRPRSACIFMQADLGLSCPLTESVDTVVHVHVYVDNQRMPRSDCMDSYADADLCCSHMT